MAIIPLSLQPPTRPPTQAELQRLKQGYAPITSQAPEPLTPEMQQQQETINKLQSEVDLAQQQLDKVEQAYQDLIDRLALGGNAPNRNDTERYLMAREGARMNLNAKAKSLQIAEKYLVDYQEAKGYGESYVQGIIQEGKAQESSLRFQRDFKQKYGVEYSPQVARQIQEQQRKEIEYQKKVSEAQRLSLLLTGQLKQPEQTLKQYMQTYHPKSLEPSTADLFGLKQSTYFSEYSAPMSILSTAKTERAGFFSNLFNPDVTITGKKTKDVKDVTWRSITPLYLSGVEKVTSPITKRLPPDSFWKQPAPDWSVELLDFYIKMGIFSPFMATATAKKGSTKAKLKEQEVKYVRKFSEMTDDEYSAFVNNLKVKANKQDLREVYRKALATGDKTKIKDVENILRDVLGDSARTLFEDVKAQEGYGFGLGDTRFSGLNVEGKISPLNTGKISPIETTGRIPTNFLEQPKPPRIDFDVTDLFTPSLSRVAEVGALGKGGELLKKPKQDTAGSLLIGTTTKPDIKNKLKEDSTNNLLTGLSTISDTRQKNKPKQKDNTALSLLTGITFSQPQIQQPKLEQPQLQTPRLKQPQPQKPRYPENPIFNFPSPRQPQPQTPKEKPPKTLIPFGFIFPSEKNLDKNAYDVFYKKGKRWEKIADDVSRITGLGIGSSFVDRDVSRRFKLVKQKQGTKIKNNVKNNSWEIHQHKYRPYRIIQGRAFPMHNEFIEKTAYAIDSPQEKKQLKRARMSNLLFNFNSNSKGRRFRI